MSDSVVGLLLAAGAGRRMGVPKALLRSASGESLLARSATSLYAGGLARVIVVLGAEAERARCLVPDEPWAEVLECPDWAEGMGASLRAGLAALAAPRVGPDTAAPTTPLRDPVAEPPAGTGAGSTVAAALVSLVDLPDVGASVVRRLLEGLGPEPTRALRRAAYAGVPGHPVLIGRAWWPPVLEGARGDQGARTVFAAHPHEVIECGDLATGRDLDEPDPGGRWRV